MIAVISVDRVSERREKLRRTKRERERRDAYSEKRPLGRLYRLPFSLRMSTTRRHTRIATAAQPPHTAKPRKRKREGEPRDRQSQHCNNIVITMLQHRLNNAQHCVPFSHRACRAPTLLWRSVPPLRSASFPPCCASCPHCAVPLGPPLRSAAAGGKSARRRKEKEGRKPRSFLSLSPLSLFLSLSPFLFLSLSLSLALCAQHGDAELAGDDTRDVPVPPDAAGRRADYARGPRQLQWHKAAGGRACVCTVCVCVCVCVCTLCVCVCVCSMCVYTV